MNKVAGLQFRALSDAASSPLTVLLDDSAGRWLQLTRTTETAEQANVAVRLHGQRFSFLQEINDYYSTVTYAGNTHTHTYTHPLNGPFSGTTQVSRYQKGKTNLDFTEARDSEWQWHQLGRMQVCTLFQADNHASTPPLSFYRPDALPAAQPTASKH